MIKQVSLKERKIEYLVLAGTLALVFFTHALNAFNFPYFENDEGTYMSQAWSVLRFRELAPYEYNFDHAPLGWLFISLWVLLTGGFYTFGFSLNSGRLFMIILHVISALLLYKFGKNLTGSKLVSLFSVLLFSLSPLAIYFQRRVLLDNMMVFWLILSLYLASRNKRTLIELILSAVSYAIAVLTKETALIFFPAMAYLVYQKAQDYSQSLADNGSSSILSGINKAIIWLVVSLISIGLYPLLAFINGQLLPSQNGINLVDAIRMQLSRTAQESSNFAFTADLWMREDPIILSLGLVATGVLSILSFTNKTARVLAFFTVLYIVYLVRGGVVFEFYLLPLLPFLALNISYLAGLIHKRVINPVIRKIPYTLVGLSLIVMLTVLSRTIKEDNLFTSNETAPQKDAVSRLLAEVPAGSKVVIDNYAYVDLNDRKPSTDTRFDYYWKVGTDPQIRNDVYQNNPANINFILSTPQMRRDISDFENLDIIRNAVEGSLPLQTLERNGYRVELLQESL